MYKKCCMLVCIIMTLSVVSACSWMGETAGRAKAGVENSVENTKEGYEKGYEMEKE